MNLNREKRSGAVDFHAGTYISMSCELAVGSDQLFEKC